MATTDCASAIFRAFLLTAEALEACITRTLGTLWLLLCQVCLLHKTASVACAEVSLLSTPRALKFTDVAHEPLVAVADRLKLVIHSALAMARAQVLILVAWAH